MNRSATKWTERKDCLAVNPSKKSIARIGTLCKDDLATKLLDRDSRTFGYLDISFPPLPMYGDPLVGPEGAKCRCRSCSGRCTQQVQGNPMMLTVIRA